MGRKKLADPRVPCEVHWSPAYSPPLVGDPGGLCNRPGAYVVTVMIGKTSPAIPCCGFHAGVVARRLRRKRVHYVVWFRRKTKTNLFARG
jgi:hypothetical protein